MSASKCRFVEVDEEKKEKIINAIDADNTKRSTITAVKLFREYLASKKAPADFENFSVGQLDEQLENFYLSMRNKKGELYKKSTVMCYRQSLQRYLVKTRPDIDILKGNAFRKSTTAFKGMAKELKREGKASVDHYPPIEEGDLDQMYSYVTSNLDDAQLLQYKVFLDIMLHFGRRGRENLAALTRADFAVTQNSEGLLYVYQTKDELTKNHQNDNMKSSDGRMYEIKDSSRCPVRSFVKYIRRLNRNSNRFFQQARNSPKDEVYYDSVSLGHNKLGQFMPDICKKAGLAKTYTNHSCRATTVHLLDVAQIPSRHIMSVTGHKSENSLKTYSGTTCEKTKQIMSGVIANKIKEKNDTSCISDIDMAMCDVDFQLLSDSQTDNLLKDVFEDDDISDILATIDMPTTNLIKTNTSSSTVYKNSNSVLNRYSVPTPIFNNCSNVTINYNILPK